MLFTVWLPRVVAEDDELHAQVEADTIEQAVIAACRKINKRLPLPGDKFTVQARVEVAPKREINLRSY